MNLVRKYENVVRIIIILSNKLILTSKSSTIKKNKVIEYRRPQQKSFVVVDNQQKPFVVRRQQKFFAIIFALISFVDSEKSFSVFSDSISFEQKFAVIISFVVDSFNISKFVVDFSRLSFSVVKRIDFFKNRFVIFHFISFITSFCTNTISIYFCLLFVYCFCLITNTFFDLFESTSAKNFHFVFNLFRLYSIVRILSHIRQSDFLVNQYQLSFFNNNFCRFST